MMMETKSCNYVNILLLSIDWYPLIVSGVVISVVIREEVLTVNRLGGGRWADPGGANIETLSFL